MLYIGHTDKALASNKEKTKGAVCTVTDKGLRPKRIIKFLLLSFFIVRSCLSSTLFISLVHACVANEILKWVGCVRRGGAVLGIVGGGVTFRFLNGEAILDENMLFWVSCGSCGCLENPTRFQTIMVKIIWAF